MALVVLVDGRVSADCFCPMEGKRRIRNRFAVLAYCFNQECRHLINGKAHLGERPRSDRRMNLRGIGIIRIVNGIGARR